VSNAKFDSKKLLENGPMLLALRSLNESMSFKRSTLAGALELVLKERATAWDLEQKHWKDWIFTMGCRIANLCRHTTQGILKSPKAPWAQQLPWNRFNYGWCDELKQCWRCRPGSRHKETATTLSRRGSSSTSLVVALFADGTEWEVAGLTNEMLDAMEQGGRPPTNNNFWEGQHSKTFHKVTARVRQDRKLLVCIFEQGRQIVQFIVDKFGPEESEEALQMAIKAAKELAQLFADDLIGRDELKTKRDELYQKYALAGTANRNARKRPAATTKDGSTPASKAAKKAAETATQADDADLDGELQEGEEDEEDADEQDADEQDADEQDADEQQDEDAEDTDEQPGDADEQPKATEDAAEQPGDTDEQPGDADQQTETKRTRLRTKQPDAKSKAKTKTKGKPKSKGMMKRPAAATGSATTSTGATAAPSTSPSTTPTTTAASPTTTAAPSQTERVWGPVFCAQGPPLSPLEAAANFSTD